MVIGGIAQTIASNSIRQNATGGGAIFGKVAMAAAPELIAGRAGAFAEVSGAEARVSSLTVETATPGTIGHLLNDFHPDSFIHITPSTPADFAAGIDEGTYFSRLGDVGQLTPEEFRTSLVGPVAGGYGPNAKLFVVVGPEASGAFRALPPEAVNLTGTTEYVSTERLTASGFVPVP